MVSVFDYTDYRAYLLAHYNDRKQENPSYSYQVMSDKMGFSDKSFIYSVIKNRKNLSKSSIFRVSRALKLGRFESEYLEHLVGFNQAKNLEERTYFFEKMQQVKGYGKGYAGAKALRKDQFEFLSNWYNPVIKALINLYGFKDDYKRLANAVTPPILPKQARKSVELLERLGIIQKQNDGSYVVLDKAMTTGKEVTSLAALNFHVQTAQLALNAIRELPKEKRFLTGVTLGISKESYDILCCKVEKLASEALELAAKDNRADKVFHMNIQIFPVAKPEEKKRPL